MVLSEVTLVLTWLSAYMPGCSVFMSVKALAPQGFEEFMSKGMADANPLSSSGAEV